MINSSLDKRLLSCADYVRAGAVFADVGTDHGYLPVFLLKSGRISRAVLSDVNPGPLNSAIRNVADAGLSDLCEFVLTDGAAALDGKGITDYAICGMGGELISDIIDAAPHLKQGDVRLILQPMTKQGHLRRYLTTNGFSIIEERYSEADGKYYVTLVAEYLGVLRYIDESEAELGASSDHIADRVEYLGYLEAKLKACDRMIDGKCRGGLSTVDEEKYRDAIIERMNLLR